MSPIQKVTDPKIVTVLVKDHVPKFNRATRRSLARKFGLIDPVIQSWQTTHRKKIDTKGVEHHSHCHTFSFSIAHSNHDHGTVADNDTESVKCDPDGIMTAHYHTVVLTDEHGSSHSVSGTTGFTSATDLNHTHTISGTLSYTGAHTHQIDSVYWSYCNYVGCSSNKHNHGYSTSGDYASNGNHSHSFSGVTGTGVGTLASHTHSVSLTSEPGGKHTHAKGSAKINSTSDCHLSNSHGHDAVTSGSLYTTHTQSIVGDTDLGGEPIVAPTVTTLAATDVQATTARLNGQISDDGGEACQYRFRYKKGIGGAYSYTTWTGAKTTGQTFYEDISGLDKKSLYYFNAQAKNSAGESAWGGELSFTTLATIPVVTTQAVSNIGTTTATGNGNITDNGGENCSKRGVCWNTTGNPTVADDKSEETDSFGTGAFSRPITGLSPGTKYYVKAYAHNSAGYGYGGEESFTTKFNAPSNLACVAQSSSQIDVNWIKGTGATKTMVRRKVGSYPSDVTDGDQAYYGTGNSFNDTSLVRATHYYYRAWSWVEGGDIWSDDYAEDNAWTLIGVPAVTTDAATALSAIAATLNGTLDDDGGEACDCGFEWGLDTGYGVTTPTQIKVKDDTFSQVIGGLFPNTTYHFRAFATNSVGTSYGDDISFTTALVVSKAFALAREEL